MTPELKRALKQLGMTLPEAEAFVRLREWKSIAEACKTGEGALFQFQVRWNREWLRNEYRLTPQGRFVAEALVRLGVGRKS